VRRTYFISITDFPSVFNCITFTTDKKQTDEKEKAEEKPAPTIRLTFEKYQNITHTLVHHIRREGGDNDDAQG
jgi:hypothetical protein